MRRKFRELLLAPELALLLLLLLKEEPEPELAPELAPALRMALPPPLPLLLEPAWGSRLTVVSPSRALRRGH